MTHVLVAIGSMGDLRPQLALARALRAEGADVLLLGLEDYAPLAADSGVPFRDVGTRLMGPVSPPLLARAARGSQTIGALLVRRWLHDSAGAIARALSRRPSVILADEPTGALDVDTGNSVMALLERQCAENGAALIIITHDLAVAGRAHTQYRLDHGVLTPISVKRQQVGSLEEFSEVVAPPDSPPPTAPTSREGAS